MSSYRPKKVPHSPSLDCSVEVLELVVRLIGQDLAVLENALRGMPSFMTDSRLAIITVAEIQFVNLSCQAPLGERYGTKLLTSIFDMLIEEGSPPDT